MSQLLAGQTILIEPYLQNASSSSVYILWETDFGQESMVEWGSDENLGNTTEGLVGKLVDIDVPEQGTRLQFQIFHEVEGGS